MVPQFGMEEGQTQNKLPSPQEGQKVVPHQLFPPTLGAAKPKSQELQGAGMLPGAARQAQHRGQICPGVNPADPVPCASPPPRHSRALHSSDAMALPPMFWQPLEREEREGGWGSRAGPLHCARVLLGVLWPCPRVCKVCVPLLMGDAPAPVSCWVIAILKCRVHLAVLMKY